MPSPRLFIHIVTFNSGAVVSKCINSLLKQDLQGYSEPPIVLVTDNGSAPEYQQFLSQLATGLPQIQLQLLGQNLGFAGGHNLGAAKFLASDCSHLLLVNPDVSLSENCARLLLTALTDSEADVSCPVLLRADSDLNALDPSILDGMGIYFTRELRHFDLGSEQSLEVVPLEPIKVAGGSGAVLMMTRRFVEEASLVGPSRDKDVDRVYPQLAVSRDERHPLFDEGFFAYREDADLAWRAQLLGFQALVVPSAQGFHVRRVTATRRNQLPPNINAWGVRNRFLLQFNNLYAPVPLTVLVFGMFWRNLLVVLGVILSERSSMIAFRELITLLPRAMERRMILRKRIDAADVKRSWRWFQGSGPSNV